MSDKLIEYTKKIIKESDNSVVYRMDLWGFIFVPFVLLYESPSAWYDLIDYTLLAILTLYPLVSFLLMGYVVYFAAIVEQRNRTSNPTGIVMRKRKANDSSRELIPVMCYVAWIGITATFSLWFSFTLMSLTLAFSLYLTYTRSQLTDDDVVTIDTTHVDKAIEDSLSDISGRIESGEFVVKQPEEQSSLLRLVDTNHKDT